MIEYKKGIRIFVDTAPIIYLLDEDVNYAERMEGVFSMLLENEVEMITSAVTCTEYLTHPYKTGNTEKVDAFFEFLTDCDVSIKPISVEAATEAARVRAEYDGFKTMDSLQLSVAKLNQCDFFLTNDKQLCQYKDVTCITVDSL